MGWPAVKATSRPSPETLGSDAKPSTPALIVVVVWAARSRSITRDEVAPGPPAARLVTAVKATKRPLDVMRGS